MTIGAYFGMKECPLDGRSVSLAIWDTAGEVHTLHHNYIYPTIYTCVYVSSLYL